MESSFHRIPDSDDVLGTWSRLPLDFDDVCDQLLQQDNADSEGLSPPTKGLRSNLDDLEDFDD